MLGYKNFTFFFVFFFLLGVTPSNAKIVEKAFNDIIAGCELCHGIKGNSTANENWPKLAGQNVNYLMKQMQDFQPNVNHGRDSPIMNSLIAALSKKEKIKIANYYANLLGATDTAHPHLLPLGQRIYRGGDADKEIPACLACHGPAGLGNPPAGFPRLSGQHAQYIVTQLKAFRDGKRNNDKYQMMPIISKKMNDAEIVAVSNYISGLYS
ncbi:c-type cytochrome [Rickettsiella endosymbiont of Miltochrista miniata]|uniref:c-type cytochrome n=1 Tax=Rickettsiella endosymbiont of Miltochrista miniata TaxID=3066239 RepID=UPI00313AF705